MKYLKQVRLAFLAMLSLSLFNCNDDSGSNSSNPVEQGSAELSFRLVDEPGDYDNVFVNVQDVMVKVNDESEGESGWQSLEAINTGVYDLLELTGGMDVLLVDGYEVPAGTLNQIRLVLGEEGNEIVVDGETHPLSTPSAQQSGLKLQVNETLEDGFTYNFLLDFDVDQSIVEAGNSGQYILKPVINVSTEVSSGQVQGAVTPFDFQVMASIEVDGEIISAYANENGVFVLNGVPAGTYNVVITPDSESGYAETVVENVTVVNGEIVDLGTIELQLIPATGSIGGIITNEGVVVTASVEVDGEIIAMNTDEAGAFLLENLPVGIYIVTLAPAEESGLTDTEIIDVEVTEGMVTDLGTITLE